MSKYLAGLGMAALFTLVACGSSPSAPASAPSAPAAASMSALATCLSQHGVTVSVPVTRKDIRAALRSVPKPTRHGAVAACQQYSGGMFDHPGRQ